ncbi:alpha/beta hydrolase [Jatrophihabitans telluris]|uniref:Alpha/beta hydrolase n=1 Tax=Jatrophihabitans telluris TaxID=2038343 RepID=A0ABY4QX33_9ACTN|nr:alpha/beta hydrolase [Jatrophihabitans telluris]UQX87914.1 alpha/beta hydrolase [Jatrophihabitans telluris]
MKGKVPALVGGAVGLAGAITAAGVAYERKQVTRQRAQIDPHSAASFGAMPVDRQSRVLTEDGISLHVEEVGPTDAPMTVVFVHGFTLDLGSFHFQRAAVGNHFGDEVRMVFYDQRSHGRSDRSPALDCTLEQLGRDLATVIEKTAPTGPLVLVGHSMGGMTVMALASLHPDWFGPDGRISHLSLINTSSGELKTVTLGMPGFLARWRGPVLPLVLRRAAKNVNLVEAGRALGRDLAWMMTKRLSFGSKNVDPAVVAYCTNMIAATPVDVVWDFYPTLMSHDGTLGLKSLLGCRVLLFGAEHDLLTPVAHSRAIAAALPDAELITVPDTGHMLMLERPDAVDGPLLELISEARTTRSRRRSRAATR